MRRAMPSQWLAFGAETDPLTRARQLQRSWERLLADGALGPELAPGATAGLRPTIVESWRRSLATGLDPTDLLAPIEADESEVLERWFEHPLGLLTHGITEQLREVAEESRGIVIVTDAAGLILHRVGDEWLMERAAEMNLVEGARYSEAADGTNGIGTALAADHAFQVFAFEHFNERHHQWICSGAPVHDPASGQVVGLVDFSSLWKIAHPRSLELVTTAARAMERCLLQARRDHDARLRRRYGGLMTRSTDLLVDRDGYMLDGAKPAHRAPLDIPQGGGVVVLRDRSVAVAEPLGQGEAYLVRQTTARNAKSAPVEALERAEDRARELAAEQAALRQVATLVARESSPDQLFAVVAEQVARVFDVPLVRLIRYQSDGSEVVGGFSEGDDEPFPIRSRWSLDSPGVIASVRRTGRPARVDDYANVPGQAAAVVRQTGMRSAVASPIVVAGRLWGAMVILCPRREPLPEDTEARLTDFTELVATAIANAESRVAIGRLVDEQAALRRVATLVAQQPRRDEVFAAVIAAVGSVLSADVAAMYVYPGDGTASVIAGWSEAGPMLPVGTTLSLDGDSVAARIFHTGAPARVDHSLHADGETAGIAHVLRLRSAVGAPILVGGNLWGAVTAGTRGEEPLSENAETRIAAFTELVGTAISNAEALRELQRVAAEQEALRRAATLVASGTSPMEVFASITTSASELFNVPFASLLRYGPDETATMVAGCAACSAYVGRTWTVPADDPGIVRTVAGSRRPARLEDHSGVRGPLGEVARALGVGSVVGVPVIVDGSLWGVLAVGAAQDEPPLPADASERLVGFTELVSTAIANGDAKERVGRLLDEQAALRRVATLVARGTRPEAVFRAVAHEVAALLRCDTSAIVRLEADGAATMMGGHRARRNLGERFLPDDAYVIAAVRETGHAARFETDDPAGAGMPEPVRSEGIRCGLATPIVVDGELWGAITVASLDRPFPPGTERRLADFTGLIAAAIANTQARERVTALADEHAALRRVATLVAQGTSADELFALVSEEVGRLFDAEVAIARFEPDGSAMVVVGLTGGIPVVTLGTRWKLEEFLASTTVYRTGRPARNDHKAFRSARGAVADSLRTMKFVSTVAAPIIVESELWGVLTVNDAHRSLPPDTEERVAKFTELIATAIANAESRAALAASEARARELANEQAALRRVAMRVAQGASADELFSAVAEEVAGIIDIPVVGVHRYEADGTFTMLGIAGETNFTVGSRWPVEDEGIAGMILATGRPARRNDYSTMRGPLGEAMREDLMISTVGVPIVVDGSIWGFMVAAAKPGKPTPSDAEERLARFTELVATAVSNATTRTELLASRARVVSTADQTRRRLERDLHDGIQQWLVALALKARRTAVLSAAGDSAAQELSGLADDLVAVTDELREISRGIHPAILSDAGLDDALQALGRRSAIRIDLDISFKGRYDPTLEATVYYVVAESITNAVKHAQASAVAVRGGLRDGAIEFEIKDDGVGGADPRRGTGMIGLKDRVDTLGGTISFASPAGAGTTIRVRLPTTPSDGKDPILRRSDEAASAPASG